MKYDLRLLARQKRYVHVHVPNRHNYRATHVLCFCEPQQPLIYYIKQHLAASVLLAHIQKQNVRRKYVHFHVFMFMMDKNSAQSTM